MKNEVRVETLTDKKKIETTLKLYGFSLTIKQLERILSPNAQVIERKTESREEISLVYVRKIIENERGNLKLVILGDGKFFLLPKEFHTKAPSLIESSYYEKSNGFLEQIQEHTWIALIRGWGEGAAFSCLTDSETEAEAQKWLSLYLEILNKREENYNFREMTGLAKPKFTELISTRLLEEELIKVNKTISEIKRLEALEKKMREEAFKNRIIFETENDVNSLVLKALDDHTYKIETPTGNKGLSSQTLEYWLEFIYKYRYYWGAREQADLKARTLFYNIIEKVKNLAYDSLVKFSVDGKSPVEMELREVKRGIRITYLNGKRIARDDLDPSLFSYFMENKALQFNEEKSEEETERSFSIRKQRESKILVEGIHGYLEDLEGSCPINIGFEKDGQRWNLTIGETKIHLKGGMGTIKSLENVLKGTAQGYTSRHSTEELYSRLSKVLPEKDVLEIIKTAKELGKLVKALDGEVQT